MLFSIVIPVYNVEKYLDECLQSILKQRDKIKNNCEILLINDGSKDSSGKICDTYAQEFPELIKVFHNKNQGLLMTRRFGFKQARGKYIVNCDSDDLLENDALEKLQKCIEKYSYPDIVIFNFCRYDGKDKNVAVRNIFSEKQDCIIEKDTVIKEFLSNHNIVSMWGKVVKRTCIDMEHDYSKFGKISTGEDTLQSIEFFNNAKTFVYLNDTLYNYRCGSGMTGKFDENYYFTFKTVFMEIRNANWNLENFNCWFAIKVLQTTGRAITQSRYKKWKSINSQIRYLKKISKDEMFRGSIRYLRIVRNRLQKDHRILLWLLKNHLNMIIVLSLNIKNLTEKSNKEDK